jgi:hypothetical protein
MIDPKNIPTKNAINQRNKTSLTKDSMMYKYYISAFINYVANILFLVTAPILIIYILVGLYINDGRY